MNLVFFPNHAKCHLPKSRHVASSIVKLTVNDQLMQNVWWACGCTLTQLPNPKRS